ANNSRVAALTITGLTPDTKYYYCIESDGVRDLSADDIGEFKTTKDGPYSFFFAPAACVLDSDNEVYDEIRQMNPLFYLCMGDLHYSDPNSNNISVHRDPYETIHSKTPAKNLFQKVPIAYIWDDHDYCGNNGAGNSLPGTENARRVYREFVPHYDLPAGTGNQPIYQSFKVGRVRFILTDLRSERTTNSMMGVAQKAWFKNEVLSAKQNNEFIAWVTSVSWAGDESDNWGGFAAEREELANFFRDNQIQNMLFLSGDAHMVAIDNGNHMDFSTGQNNPYKYPMLQAAAVTNLGSDKGGTYSEGGTFTNQLFTGQFGTVSVIDDGNQICFELKGYRRNFITNSLTLLTSYQFCRTMPFTTSTSSMLPPLSCKVFPNPSLGTVEIQMQETTNGLVSLQVTDLQGKIVFDQQKKIIGFWQEKLDLSHLPKATYLLSITFAGKNYQTKLVLE
ncbi:MAG: alkaline phosphatase D family protein, partial [Bacteroidia bacterium]|nr:alkaline phosphatase D family protein [Bacteroidia bacterium]